MNYSESKRNFGLDVIRAIAISFVLISHCTLLIFRESTSHLILFVRTLGAIGVDLFFVLSGFLIGGLLIKNIELNKNSFNDLFVFWKRRWLRTLPNYYLILMIIILLSLVSNQELPKNLYHYFFFIQNFSSPQPNYFTESWSLTIEEFAYLIIPFLLYTSIYFFKNVDRLRLFVYVTIFAILLLFTVKVNYFLNTNIQSYKHWSSSFRKVVIYRMDAIYMGFLVIYLFKKHLQKIQNLKNNLFLAGLLVLFLTHLSIYLFNILPETNKGFYTFFYLQLVIIGLGFTFPFFYFLTFKVKGAQLVYFLSVHSYSIYLINYSIVLLILESVFNISNFSIYQKIGVTMLFLAITFGLSKIIYKYFELPILKYRNSKILS